LIKLDETLLVTFLRYIFLQ